MKNQTSVLTPSTRGWLTCLTLVALVAQPSVAEELYLIEGVPDPTTLGALMYPETDEPKRELRVRAIRFTDTKPTAEPEADSTTQIANTADAPQDNSESGAAIGFNIQFELDSPDLLPQSLPYLDAVGAMLLQERTRDARLVIAGHADATGDAQYNQALSEARAKAVSEYLATNYQIAGQRLETVGYGEEQPLPETDPNDGINRRVEFHPIP